MSAVTGPVAARTAVPVWDRFVRIFHWSLVSCVLLNYFVVDDGEWLHQGIGYAAAALVVARIVWGFIGTRHARFSDFVPTPGAVLRHVRGLVTGRLEPHDGHNPLGALMMLTQLTLVLAIGVTGFMQTTDAYWGVEWVQELHETLASTLIALSFVHAASAIVMGRIERTRLVRAMVTGVKVRW